jgi:hypothetical protein
LVCRRPVKTPRRWRRYTERRCALANASGEFDKLTGAFVSERSGADGAKDIPERERKRRPETT